MANRSKARGTRFETEVARYLGVERRTLKGSLDQGDLIFPGWTLELKATREINLAGAIDEAAREARNAGTALYAAVVKRRGKAVEAAYVVLPLALFARIARGVAI